MATKENCPKTKESGIDNVMQYHTVKLQNCVLKASTGPLNSKTAIKGANI